MNGDVLMRPPDLFNKVQYILSQKRSTMLVSGRMVVDSQYMAFCPDQNLPVMQMPVCSLESLDRRIEGGDSSSPGSTASETNRHIIDIGFKTCERWKLLIIGDVPANEFYIAITIRMSQRPDDLQSAVIAFHYTPPFSVSQTNGWDIYDQIGEMKRIFQHVDKKYHWKICQLNSDYHICGSYPQLNYVPPYFDDGVLKQAAAFRDGCRFPALSWVHPTTFASLTRCSQPLPGRLGGKRCPEDEHLIAEIFKSNPNSPDFGGYILDARPYSSAMANRAMGAGFERSEHYGGAKLEFLGIENIHVVRESLDKLKRAIRTALPGPGVPAGILGTGVGGLEINTWFDRLADCGWLKHLQNVMNGSVLAATLIHFKKVSVLVHCSHGWDRTAQLTSLPMIMLDPYYRTYAGIQVLIEKEWVAFGHKFLDRCNHTAHPTLASKEESPIFLQFLDAVHQICYQFPTHFEYNDKFLIDLVTLLYSCQYGTFLTNNQQQQIKLDIIKKTFSVWSYFNHPSIKPQYLNPLYTPTEIKRDEKTGQITTLPFLKPSTAGNKLHFWDALYNRSENDPGIDVHLLAKITELQSTNQSLEQELQKLKELLAKQNQEPSSSAAPVSVIISPEIPTSSSEVASTNNIIVSSSSNSNDQRSTHQDSNNEKSSQSAPSSTQ